VARKMVIWREDGSRPMLREVLAEDEFQLQEIVKENPDLLPVDEFEVIGPLLVVGRETSLPSGAPDLLCVTRSGDLFIVEFKTGPQNSDFRRVLAQLLDYGSDLWQMSYEEFESTVANRYFSSDYCRDQALRGKTSLSEAVHAFWSGIADEDLNLFRENLSQRLDAGAFTYVLVAQQFTQSMEKTIEYLNAALSEARIYAVELVRFAAEDLSAFETRMVLKPEVRRLEAKRKASTSEAQFLEQIDGDAYHRMLRNLLEVCRGLGLRIGRGKRGLTIRLATPDRAEPVSIAWIFPPGVSGWMGLTDLTMGFDIGSAEETPSISSALESYAGEISKLPGVEPARRDWLRGCHLSPELAVRYQSEITNVLAELVRQAGGEA
jgi:hypothetical protein